MRKVCVAGRALHLPQGTIRHPQAVALSFISGWMGDGTAGRGPSLHMDASASILRPLSPYGPDKRGLPSFPRFPALRCCGSSVRRGIRCCGLGGQGAWQPSLRSGRLRRPARAEWDNSRRRTPCPHCLMLVRRIVEACSSFMRIRFVSGCSGGQETCPLRSRHFPFLLAGGGRTVRLHSCGVPVVSLQPLRVLRSSHYSRRGWNLPPSST